MLSGRTMRWTDKLGRCWLISLKSLEYKVKRVYAEDSRDGRLSVGAAARESGIHDLGIQG